MKRILLFITTIFMIILLSGCGKNNYEEPSLEKPKETTNIKVIEIEEMPENEYRIYFYIDGNLDSYLTTKNCRIREMPSSPDKKNHNFLGWYTEEGYIYNFYGLIYIDKTFNLYARFEFDLEKVANNLSVEHMSTNVHVGVKHYDQSWGIESNQISVFGSGVIFADANELYYVLTNNHVVYDSRSKHEYTIIDYKGNKYKANLRQNSNQAEYDLAVLTFKKGKEELTISEFAEKNPKKNEKIIAIGQPEGQKNVMTFGEVLSYQTITLKDTSLEAVNVSFSVIRHSAPTASGSSGCAILNYDFKIVGIHFAGPKGVEFKDRKYGYCIPIEKIFEYLDLYIYG